MDLVGLSFDQFLQSILVFLPDAEVGEDNDGQLIIYTALILHNDQTVPFGLEDTIDDKR